MKTLREELEQALLGRCPLVYIQTAEEERVCGMIKEIAKDREISKWSCTRGFESDSTRDPVAAVETITSSGKKGFFILTDIADFLDTPALKRALKEFGTSPTAGRDAFIFMLDTERKIPNSLNKHIHLIIAPLADADELTCLFEQVSAEHKHSESIDDQFKDDVVTALRGLNIAEAESILHRILQSGKTSREDFFDALFSEKQMIVRKAGYLEFTVPSGTIDSMGGLGNLKDWLVKRRKIFSREALDASIPIPKGLLIMGVSGCGKSMAVKTIPALWNVPMYRLDMNLIFSGIYGSPEETFHKALQTLENVAPAVLWIDEIENALGIEEDGLTISSHIFSSFLTWMQEKPPLVFIAATANKINALPAELIRKGRFDQIFFVDLPSEEERKEIFKVYLQKYGADPASFDLKMLSIMTKNWNGAEIEQVVSSARTDAFYENRQFNEKDVSDNIAQTVPLSTTMETQIKNIRSWAISRATPASKQGRILRH